MQHRRLAQPNARFTGDAGAPDPVVRAALSAVVDEVSYARAVVALCASRLLMPIVASGDETDHPDPQRHAELAAVTLDDGEAIHLLAFTGLDAMRLWRPDARPVPCLMDELCATVPAAGATRLLVDAAGPAAIVLEAGMVDQIATGHRLVEFEGEGFAWVSLPE